MTRKNPRSTRLLPAALLVVSSCDADIHRTVTFETREGLPSAHSVVVGRVLRVEIDRLETPAAGMAYAAWALDPVGWHRLGSVGPDTAASFDGEALGLLWGQVSDVVVATEPTATPGEAPTAPVQFQGAPGGPMRFGGNEGPDPHDFGHGDAMTADLEDREFSFMAHGLPMLAGGSYYAVWMLEATEEEGGWEHSTFLGRAKAGDTVHLVADELLAAHRALAITIELEQGVKAPSVANTVAYGEIPPEPGEDEHGGGHMH